MTVRLLSALAIVTSLSIVTAGCSGVDAESGGYHEVTSLDTEAGEPSVDTQAPAAGQTTDPVPEEPGPATSVDVVADAGTDAIGTTVAVEEPLDTTATDTLLDKPKSTDEPPALAATLPNDPDSENTPKVDNPNDKPGVASTGDVSGTPGEKIVLTAAEPRQIKLLIPERDFKVEGPDEALRVSFDDVDLLKILNMEPVVPDAPKLMPEWLKGLDGKRIRVRGFMYPPFQDTGLEAFILARDNQICCFGRDPKVYDLVRVLMREDVTTDYIENRPFDVVGTFKIGDDASIPGKLYTLDDAVVISR